ncbi:MAG: 2-hydroxyacid dehydrogenase [Alphaproteobacteria bacterium]|jgi:phosphoglycerate dehydrogenase-like enzyme|nr:2-hydroxyacid dehydrogenase [Alphaproteobacteria bacterium]
MAEPLTLLLAGRMSEPREEWMREHLSSEWNMLTWTEDEPFERFVELVPQAHAIVGGRIKGDWPPVPNLKLYQIPFTGYDWIGPSDVPEGCMVCNAYGHEIAIAEYVLGGLLEWEIGLRAYDRRFREFGWEERVPGIGPSHGELHGKTLGIVGYGHIGVEIAHRARAFGLKVIAVNRTRRPTPAELDWLGTLDELDRLLGESDYVVVALPLADETRGLIDAERLAAMKPDGVIVNVGRGHVIEEEALYTALAERRIGGAIVDVWYGYATPENPDRGPSEFPFQNLDNIIMTPHTSSRTAPSRERRWLTVASNLDRLARGEALENICFEGIARC